MNNSPDISAPLINSNFPYNSSNQHETSTIHEEMRSFDIFQIPASILIAQKHREAMLPGLINE